MLNSIVSIMKTVVSIACVGSLLTACTTLPGAYSGLPNTPQAAVTKIGCFKYTEQTDTVQKLTFDEANLCEDQAIKCQLQQNAQGSGYTETLVANGVVSAGLGAGTFGSEASLLGYAAKVASRFPVAGAAVGAIGSVNGSSIIYSQAQIVAISDCAKQFLGYWKTLHKDQHPDIFIAAEQVRNNIAGNVAAADRSKVRYH
jgi:hypothetical protein